MPDKIRSPQPSGYSSRDLDPGKDAAALKALTHPLRIRMLGMLRMEGPATASELAARTGESSASTSYHLRVLAKYAFIEEAAHRDGRERRWQAVHEVTSWSNAAMTGSVEARAFVDVSRRAQLDHLERSLVRHQEDLAAGRLGDEWLEPSGFTDLVARLTPEAVTELWETFNRAVAELAARDEGDPRAEQVVLFAAGLAVHVESRAGKQTGNQAEDRAGNQTHAQAEDRAEDRS
ncbi:ArsR/SmtB family transcription factor [Streptomyces peucetius]|uniref:Helix-turn-helix domain-containing protein n=1 Tax=Streptomyces peucetius TaxID=1950 RepID=A0ABY6I7B2_STRPE|nr:helix-turn-helix domain-containing protein [Streptomyces peucetius]UYQ62892.1 helix-turn-helix domain-containing protein [Streptomyces peucetius]